MKQLKINVGKKGEHQSKASIDDHSELKDVLEKLKKKGLNPRQICNKLIEHEVPSPAADEWSYDLVVEQCKRLKVH